MNVEHRSKVSCKMLELFIPSILAAFPLAELFQVSNPLVSDPLAPHQDWASTMVGQLIHHPTCLHVDPEGSIPPTGGYPVPCVGEGRGTASLYICQIDHDGGEAVTSHAVYWVGGLSLPVAMRVQVLGVLAS